jgi:hypothetical protein
MPPSSKKPKTKFLVELSPQLALDLAAFLRVHFDASRATVIREALNTFLQDQLMEDSGARRRFEHVRKELGGEGGPIRLVEARVRKTRRI